MWHDDVRWLSYGQHRPARHPNRSMLGAVYLLGVFPVRLLGQGERGKVEKTGGAQLVKAGQLV